MLFIYPILCKGRSGCKEVKFRKIIELIISAAETQTKADSQSSTLNHNIREPGKLGQNI